MRQTSSGLFLMQKNVTKGFDVVCDMPLSARQRKFILAGGVLNSLKKSN